MEEVDLPEDSRASQGDNNFVFIEEDEQAINDFHQHHTLVRESTLQQKFFRKM